MADIELTFEVTEEESLDADMRAIMNELIGASVYALEKVEEVTTETLRKHINSDVYPKYPPRVYKRRSEDPSLGTPLNDMQKNVTQFKPFGGRTSDTSFAVTGGISYDPTGEHQVLRWHDADENELIGRIENFRPPYNWYPKDPPPIPERPFWQNTVGEMTDGGEAERAIIWAFGEKGIELDMDSGVERESSDGDY